MSMKEKHAEQGGVQIIYIFYILYRNVFLQLLP